MCVRYFLSASFDGCAWLCAELEARKWFLLPTCSAPALSSTPPMITFLPITFVNIRLDVFSCLNSVGAVFHFLVAHRAKSSCVLYSSRVSLVPHTLHLYELHIVHPTFPLLIPCYLQILFVSKLNKQTKRLQFCAICTPLAGIGVSIWLIGSKLATAGGCTGTGHQPAGHS